MSGRDSSQLTVSVSRDHDGECSVVVTLTSGFFGGRGRAWLHIADVSDFISATKQLAATSCGEAVLRGGYMNPDGTPLYTVDLVFRAHRLRGYILLMANLSSGPSVSNAEAQVVSRVSATLIIEPAALDRFADHLSNIPSGGTIEAVVEGECAA